MNRKELKKLLIFCAVGAAWGIIVSVLYFFCMHVLK